MADAGVKAKDRQQAQNQIEHLYKQHLIAREENDFVSEGSRYLYSKDETVRALREEIIKYADKPALRSKLATKRRPAGTVSTSIRTITKAALRKKPRKNVFYLTADPDKAHSLRVDVEVRRVQDAIRGSDFRDNINVQYRPTANIGTLPDGLNDLP